MDTDAFDWRKVAAARVFASAQVPYLARALFAATIRCSPDIGTIAVDRRWRLHADPSCIDRLSVDEIGRLLVHLVSHVIRSHGERAGFAGVEGGATAVRWNRCVDAEVNDDLVTDSLVPRAAPELPEDLGCPPRRLAEDYYGGANEGSRLWDCGSGADGEKRSWDSGEGLSRAEQHLLRESLAVDVRRHNAQEPGTVAKGWLRWAEKQLPSSVDWRRVLAAEVHNAVASVAGSADFSYRSLSRRGAAVDPAVLPSLRRPAPDVAIVCDTSGSMDDRLLGRALAEIERILSRAGLRQTRIPVLAVDSAVHTVSRVRRSSQLMLAGGGGTDMGRGIDAASRLQPRPSIVVVLTDGFTEWPARPPRGARVVVGLLDQATNASRAARRDVPRWARTVLIEEL